LNEVGIFLSISEGKRCEATKVIIDGHVKTTVVETQPVKLALMAELAWAELYATAMHKDLVLISTTVSKSDPMTFGPEMKKSAEKLRDQLQSANRTVGELSDHAGISLVPVKK
jgi:hypothetical protein